MTCFCLFNDNEMSLMLIIMRAVCRVVYVYMSLKKMCVVFISWFYFNAHGIVMTVCVMSEEFGISCLLWLHKDIV